jgi:hypothetical protein
MMRSTWSMLRRWITTFITIGQPWSLMSAATGLFRSKVLVCDRKSFISRVGVLEGQLHVVEPAAFRPRRALA